MQSPPPPATLAAAIHRIQLSLLSTPSSPPHHLTAAALLLSRPDFLDIVTERSISLLCGHPICPHPLTPTPTPSRRFRLALSEHRVYDVQDTHKYCSEQCLISARSFAETLPEERIADVDVLKLERVMRVFSGVGTTVPVSKTEKMVINIREKNDPLGGEVGVEEWIGPADAVEGYVSRRGNVLDVDVSEQIAKQLEEIAVSESKPKHGGKVKSNASRRVDFESSIIVGGHVKQSVGGSRDEVKVEKKKAKKRVSEGKSQLGRQIGTHGGELKSSMRNSGSAKLGSRSVKWADEMVCDSLEGKMGGLQINESSEVLDQPDGDSLRVAAAEACAAALIQAAEAVVSGDSETQDAVADAGIVILPELPPEFGENRDSEANEDLLELDNEVSKWPMKTVLLDTDMFEVEDSWHDTPPEGFGLNLSPFATMWMSLFGWITCSSLAYIYGQNESSHEDYLTVNGREYPRKIVLRDGKSSEIRLTINGFISRALPALVSDLMLPTPVSTVEKALGCLLDTMTFVDALPSLRTRQWHVIVLLLIDALSVHRLPDLAPHVINRNMLLHKVLNAAKISGEEYESMKDLVLPLGRLPQFSLQSGG